MASCPAVALTSETGAPTLPPNVQDGVGVLMRQDPDEFTVTAGVGPRPGGPGGLAAAVAGGTAITVMRTENDNVTAAHSLRSLRLWPNTCARLEDMTSP